MNQVGKPAEALTDRSVSFLERVGMMLLVAAVACRNLFPSEDAVDGSGTYFIPLSFLVGACLLAERILSDRRPSLVWPAGGWSLLLAGWACSGWHAEYRFPAINLFWEWVSVGILSLYAWHAGAKRGSTVIASLLLTLALMQSLLAGYESLVSIPNLRALYERNDPAVLNAVRELGVERGSKLEESFRNRLYSSEPLGTTGHPNSLAAVLVLAMPLVLLSVRSSFNTPYSRWAGIGGSLLLLTAVVTALLMTKSRSAWIAVVPGVITWWMLRPEGRFDRSWRWIGMGGCLVSLLVASLAGLGILDREILTQAGQSLSYRWEWWQGTLPVIASSVLWGVGAGHFRNHYLMHKLPFSSEEIADPHQFILELWATGGLLVLLAYLGLLIYSLRKGLLPADRPNGDVRIGLSREGWIGLWVAVVLVATLEIGLVPLLARPDEHASLLAIIVAGGTVSMLGWIGVRWKDEHIRPAIVGGVVGLHVHYLAAGGVAFPALMSASLVSLSMIAGSLPPRARMSIAWAGLASFLLAVVSISYAFCFLVPRVERDQLLTRARRMEQRIGQVWSVTDPAVRPELWAQLVPEFRTWTELCREAAGRVPGDREGWDRLAMAESTYLRLLAKLRQPDEEQAFRRAKKAWDQSLELDPRRSISWSKRGALYREVAASGLGKPDDRISWKGSAYEDFLRSAELYPQSAIRHWDLAGVLEEVGNPSDAVSQYREALRLDQTPHEDKRLTRPQRQWAEAYILNHDKESTKPAQ
jgi:hypothetical protein